MIVKDVFSGDKGEEGIVFIKKYMFICNINEMFCLSILYSLLY